MRLPIPGGVKGRLPNVLVIAATLMLAPTAAAAERREIPAFRSYGEPASPDDAARIDGLVERFRTTWATQDADALIALHAEDVEWINAYARMFQGSQPLADFLVHRLFPAFDPAVSRQEAANMKTISVRYLGDDAAVIHMYTDGQRGPSRNEGEDMRRTHIHLVLAKQGSEWKIVHTAIMDAR